MNPDNRFRKIIVIILITFNFIYSSFNIIAQKPTINGTFDFIGDNREYFSQYAKAQTILGARVDLNTEFSDSDSTNLIILGMNYLYEFGYIIDGYKPILDLYYHYNNHNIDFYFGSFPRKNLLNYPLVLLTDTLLYYRPNVEGALGQISGERGYLNSWLDWTGRQTDTAHEAFLAGISGRMNINIFYGEEYLYMYHRAGVGNPALDTNHIRDNGGGAAFIGIDLSQKWLLDQLLFDVGAVFSYDRSRPDPYEFASGFMARIKTQYKRVGIDGVYYNGGKQSLAYGDPFYSAGKYSRVDLYFIPFKSKRVTSKVAFGLHFAPDQFDVSQQVFVTMKFL